MWDHFRSSLKRLHALRSLRVTFQSVSCSYFDSSFESSLVFFTILEVLALIVESWANVNGYGSNCLSLPLLQHLHTLDLSIFPVLPEPSFFSSLAQALSRCS